MDPPAPPLTVLLLEDDDVISTAVSAVAERCGASLLPPTTSASDALAAADRHLPGVVVVDLDLSGVLGMRLVPALLAASPRCAVIVISAYERLRDKVLDAGAVAMFDPTDLRLLDACLRWVRSAPPTGGGCPGDHRLGQRRLRSS